MFLAPVGPWKPLALYWLVEPPLEAASCKHVSILLVLVIFWKISCTVLTRCTFACLKLEIRQCARMNVLQELFYCKN